MKQHTDLTKQSGSIPIATQNDQLTGLDSTEPRRVLCCGPSGCGKSYNFMLPNLLEAIERGEPIVATDPLGFLEEHASEAAKDHGYEIVRVDTQGESTEHWDLQQLRPCENFSEEDFCEWATNIYKMLTPTASHSDSDFYFRLGSALFSATIQYAIEKSDAHSFQDVLDVYLSATFSKQVTRSVRALVPRAGVRKPKAHTRQDALEMLRDGSSNLYANVSMASAFLLSKLVKGKLHAELAEESSFRFDQVWSSKKTLVGTFWRPEHNTSMVSHPPRGEPEGERNYPHRRLCRCVVAVGRPARRIPKTHHRREACPFRCPKFRTAESHPRRCSSKGVY